MSKKFSEVTVKAYELPDLQVQISELRKYDVPGWRFQIMHNSREINRETENYMDSIRIVKEKHLKDAKDQLSGSKMIAYEKGLASVGKEDVKLQLCLVPITELDAIDDLPSLAYCLPCLSDKPDGKRAKAEDAKPS